MSAPAQGRPALIAATLCYLIWGVSPLIFQATARAGADALEIMAHRILWGFVCTFALVAVTGQTGAAFAAVRNPRTLAALALSAVLVATNWGLYIWAVTNGHTLETSLGYYINPLLSMAAGAMLFGERMDRLGRVAIALAVIGVAVQTLALGRLPFLSLALAFSFAAYGVVRKRVKAEAQTGLLVECLVLLPAALAWLVQLQIRGGGHFGLLHGAAFWLLLAGPMTTAPLTLFAWAARRMPLSTMGFMQFLAPSISFCIGVSQGEPLTPLRALSFGFIWAGAAVFIYGAVRRVAQVKARGVRDKTVLRAGRG